MLTIFSSVVWIDFLVILYSKYYSLGQSLDRWYSEFGIVAVLSDCLVIVLGIMIAKFLYPSAELWTLILVALVVQNVHDYLFYVFVIKPIPTGTNRMIDVFKSYSEENSWKILVSDSTMMIGTILLSNLLNDYSVEIQSFTGLLGLYALTYIIYTKNANK